MHRLEAGARTRGETNIECWRVRTEPLPLSRVIKAEAKTYTGNWRPIELVSVPHFTNPEVRGIAFNNEIYCSVQIIRDGCATAYTGAKMSVQEWAETGFVVA